MIWLIFALILVPAVLMLLKGGRTDLTDTGAADHYRAQLREIEAEAEAGSLSPEAARQARLEIERRILRLADEKEARESSSAATGKLVPAIAVVFLLGTAALYAYFGKPGLPSQVAEREDLLAMQLTEDGPTYGAAIAQIETHLANNPDDVQGWEVLAKSARGVRQYSKAANAFARLAELEPRTLNWKVQQLNSFIAMGRGQISPAARLLIGQILEAEPEHPAGQYYLGLARQQAGDNEGAKAIWLALADRSDRNAPWMSVVRDRLRELGVAPPALSAEDRAMVDEMTADERDAFIGSMVERLRARLESNPSDAEGWMMLARSEAALGDKEAAIATLERAIGLVDPSKRASLQAFLDNLRQSANP
jgi:cytochrome c-type biogenesis protein CcmH